MRTSAQTRSAGVPLCAATAVLLTLAQAAVVAGQPAPGSALNQLQAAQAAVARMQQNPPAVPDNFAHAKDLNEANRQFLAWQAEMLKQRAEQDRRQERMLFQKMKVPPPLPPSLPPPEPPMIRLDVPLLLRPDINISYSVGKPKIAFGGKAKGELFECVGGSFKLGAAYTDGDNHLVVDHPLEVHAAFGSEKWKGGGTYQLWGESWKGSGEEDYGAGEARGKPAGGELSFEGAQWFGAVGYNNRNELSAALGYDFIKSPKRLEKVVKGSVGLEGKLEVPVVVHGLTRGGRKGFPTMLAEYSAKVVKMLTEPEPCPYCTAQGALTCPTCKNKGTITCPDCSGKKRHICPNPKCHGGKVDCSRCKGTTKEQCGYCSGKGRLRCPYCHGSGQVTVWEEETGTRERTVSLPGGFDSAGQPVYIQSTRTETYTERVPHREWCSGCDGSGLGDKCTNCSGTGKITCRKCRGTGKTDCKTCKGTNSVDCKRCRQKGIIPCPTCKGKPLVCPLCKGKKELGS